jgi:prepilin-type N-terminal cleavage/methylation domain-containing protein
MHRNEKGFTLMEMMVVIVIVAILAAVAVPLYINYVKDAQRTDAKAAIGAVITAEQTFYLKSPPGQTPTYGSLEELQAAGLLDAGFVGDVKSRWTPEVSGTTAGFSVQLTGKDPTVWVKYEYSNGSAQGSTGGGTWTQS